MPIPKWKHHGHIQYLADWEELEALREELISNEPVSVEPGVIPPYTAFSHVWAKLKCTCGHLHENHDSVGVCGAIIVYDSGWEEECPCMEFTYLLETPSGQQYYIKDIVSTSLYPKFEEFIREINVIPCGVCGATGRFKHAVCPTCNGLGYIRSEIE